MINKINSGTNSPINSNSCYLVSMPVLLEGEGETEIVIQLSDSIDNFQLYKMILDRLFDPARFEVGIEFYTISLLQKNGQEVKIPHEGKTSIHTINISTTIKVQTCC